LLTNSLRHADATPYASSLIEGLRDFGYSLETSLADIVDNSITAGARRVDILANTTGDHPWIAVVDDGNGMSEGALVEAMRPGSRNPKEDRLADDLGRFGLGLKSASFAQARMLSVYSRSENEGICATWDLDEVAKSNAWQISLQDAFIHPAIENMNGPSGTAVIWQKLDRLDGGYRNNAADRARTINASISHAEQHLRLVFHRFMEGTRPRLRLFLNGRLLAPIDPFAESNPATQFDQSDDLPLSKGLVGIRCVTLPHHKKMSKVAWEETGGPEGHLKSQGLYIYRADRLIIAGGWLGLTRQTELTKLCRVKIDIPNSMDADWKIDVKKASAQLPPVVRDRLRRVVERFVGTSKRTYRKRGRKLVDEQRDVMWAQIKTDENIIFRPNLEHPVFEEFRDRLNDDQLAKAFNNCIALLGATLPIETLHADLLGTSEALISDPVALDALRQQIEALIPKLLERKIPEANIPDVLRNDDLIKANWADAEPIILEFLGESK
jgi:hypothetical protein